jgi:hypothetical protein
LFVSYNQNLTVTLCWVGLLYLRCVTLCYNLPNLFEVQAMIITPSYQELVIYLAEKATPEEILAFHVSEAVQFRAEELTERTKQATSLPKKTRTSAKVGI